MAQLLDRLLPSASLKTYLVAVILLATLPIALLLTWKVASDARSGRNSAVALLQQSAASVAQAAEQDLAASTDALTALSLGEGLQQGDLVAFEKHLRQTPLRRSQWRSVFLTDAVGRTLLDTASPTNAPLPRHEETRTLVFKVLARGRPAVSEVSWLGAEGTQVVVMAVPVYRDGVVQHVLGARMTTATWVRLLDALAVPEHGFIALFDGEERVLALKEKNGTAASAAEASESMQLAGQMAQALRNDRNAPRSTGLLDALPVLAAWRQVDATDWKAGVGMASAPIEAAEHAIVLSALTTLGACLLLGVSLALLLAWRLAEPLRRLASGSAIPLAQPLPVLEIAQLRQALLAARQRDGAARRLLQRKAVEFETLFNHSPIGLAFAEDCSGNRVLYNPAMRQLMGEDAPGHSGAVEMFHQGRLLQLSEQPLVRACRRAEAVQAMEMEVRVQGRAPAYVVAHAVPLLDAKGRPRGAISAIMDITEIRQVVALWLAADAGQQSKQRLVDLAQEAGQVGFFEYRYRTDAMTCTPGLRRLLGVSDSEPLQHLQDWLALLDARDRTQVRHDLTAAVVRNAERTSFECRVQPQADGEPQRWVACRMRVYYTSDGRPDYMTGTAVDATEQKKAQLREQHQTVQEQAARQQAEEASRAKDEFLTLLSHGLRNPLGAIMAALEVLHSGVGGSTAGQRALAVIDRQTRHLTHMVGDLLEAGRVVKGKVTLLQAPLDLAQVVEDVRNTLEVGGELAHHAWQFSLEPAPVHGDAVRLEQVVANLLANAMQYSPAGAPIEVEVRRSADGSALLRVCDQGTGIATELLPQIFELFVQGERPLHQRGGGLGVGLTLVRRLVELHGGTVQVDTAPGQGSTFTVCLPAPLSQPGAGQSPDAVLADGGAEGSERSEGSQSRARRQAPMNLVLIEDNDGVRQSLQATLEFEGHHVASAADGRKGLDLLLALRPDAAMVDIGLPGLDGFQVARRARAGGYAGRLVAMTGDGQSHSRRDALKAGFDAYLLKPAEAHDWRAALAG